MKSILAALWASVLCLWAPTASGFSLLDGTSADRMAFVPQAPAVKPDRQSSSLFIGQEGASFFAPFPHCALPKQNALYSGRSGTQVARIRHLIGRAEAGKKGYDAVQYGARIKPSKPPTAMTIKEIYDWIDATPGQPHAIGRYQFIPKTLRSLIRRIDVPETTRFSPQLQDQLADILLVEAGLVEVTSGNMTRRTFMKNIAKIWAGLPLPNGKSYYHGHAGNKATMSWAVFEREMARIFPG